MSRRSTELICEDGFRQAEIVDGLEIKDLVAVENGWSHERAKIREKLISAGVPLENWPQSLGWSWHRKVGFLQYLEVKCEGIELGGQWQGIMMMRLASHTARLANNEGKPIVYVDFLEAAPWNWSIPSIGQQRMYKPIGSTLISVAVELSFKEGFQGRIGLHALRQSERFYSSLGLVPLGRDPHKEDLEYFELPREVAKNLRTE